MSDGTQDPAGAALVKSPEPRTAMEQIDSKGPLTPGVSAPVPQTGINHLAMNVVVPGLGSLVRGQKGLGAAQLVLAVSGLLLLLSGHWMLGPVLMAGTWIWSIITGIGFLRENRSLSWR